MKVRSERWFMVLVALFFLLFWNESWGKDKLYRLLYFDRNYVERVIVRDENENGRLEWRENLYLTVVLNKKLDNIYVRFHGKEIFSQLDGTKKVKLSLSLPLIPSLLPPPSYVAFDSPIEIYIKKLDGEKKLITKIAVNTSYPLMGLTAWICVVGITYLLTYWFIKFKCKWEGVFSTKVEPPRYFKFLAEIANIIVYNSRYEWVSVDGRDYKVFKSLTQLMFLVPLILLTHSVKYLIGGPSIKILNPSTVYASVPKVSTESKENFAFGNAKARKCVRKRHDYWLIAIAEGQYIELPRLKTSENDVGLMKRVAVCYLGVPEENVVILRNPTKAYLRAKLNQILGKLKDKARKVYFYYSGHGILDTKGNFYFLPVDASVDTIESLKETGISITEIKRMLSKVRGQKVAFIDACRVNPPWKPAVLVYKPKLTNMAFIFSSKEGQVSTVDRSKQYSAFTRALYELVKSPEVVEFDRNKNGYLEAREIYYPLKELVQTVSLDSTQVPEIWGSRDVSIFPLR